MDRKEATDENKEKETEANLNFSYILSKIVT